MAKEIVAFSQAQAKRIGKAVQAIEGTPQQRGGSGQTTRYNQPQFFAKIVAVNANGSHDWQQVIRVSTDTWVDGDLSGSESNGNELLELNGGEAEVDKIYPIFRLPVSDGIIVNMKWAFVLGGGGGSEIEPGAYQHMVYSTLASNSVGWDFPRLHEVF